MRRMNKYKNNKEFCVEMKWRKWSNSSSSSSKGNGMNAHMSCSSHPEYYFMVCNWILKLYAHLFTMSSHMFQKLKYSVCVMEARSSKFKVGWKVLFLFICLLACSFVCLFFLHVLPFQLKVFDCFFHTYFGK